MSLPDPLTVSANWLALSVFGRDQADPRAPTRVTLHGIRLSAGSVALLYAEADFLIAIYDAAWLAAVRR